MILSNQVVVILLGVIFGAAVSVNIVGAESYLLSVAKPSYAMVAGVAAGVGFWAFLRYLNLRRLKFATFATLAGISFGAILTALTLGAWAQVPRACIWFFLAIFAHRFFRWIVSQLVLRHLDPARSQAQLSYLVATYEGGMFASLLALKLSGIALTPNAALKFTAAACALGATLLGLQFMPRMNFEIRFTHRTEDAPPADEGEFRKLLWTFGLLAFCMGTFKVAEEYLVRLTLKQSLPDYASIRNMIVDYRLAGNGGIMIFGITTAMLMQKLRLSPLLIMNGVVLVLSAICLGCIAHGPLALFGAFEVTRWIGENFFYFISTQLITAGFANPYRQRLAWRQNFMFFVAAGVPVTGLVFAMQGLDASHQRPILLALISCCLAGVLYSLWRLGPILAQSLYGFVSSGHKSASILAVNLLSFLRPANYSSEMRNLLGFAPKKLLRKTIIRGLGYSTEPLSLEAVIREFESDQEEIQMAVIEALRTSKRYRGVQFLTRITRAEVKPKTIRVRINATAALAELYGRQSIPFLLFGLDDSDSRIVANTLETLSEFRDRELVAFFESFIGSPVQRVRANALMGIAPFRRTRERYRRELRAMLDGTDKVMCASALYVVGKLRDRDFMGELDRIFHATGPGSYGLEDPSIRRCMAWSLVRIDDPRGLPLVASIFLSDPGEVVGFMHFFAQFSRETRMDLVRHLLLEAQGKPVLGARLEESLNLRTYDFHEELDFYYLLKSEIERELAGPKAA